MDKYKIFYPGAGRDFLALTNNEIISKDENQMISSSTGVGFFSILSKHLQGNSTNEHHNFLPMAHEDGQFIDIIFCDNGDLDFDKLSSLAIHKLISELEFHSTFKVKNYIQSKGTIRYTKSLDNTPSAGRIFFSEYGFDYKNINLRFRYFECSWKHAILYLSKIGWRLDNDDSLILDLNFNGGEGSHSFGSYLHDVIYYDRDEFVKSEFINILPHRYLSDDSERISQRLQYLRHPNSGRLHISNYGSSRIEW